MERLCNHKKGNINRRFSSGKVYESSDEKIAGAKGIDLLTERMPLDMMFRGKEGCVWEKKIVYAKGVRID